MKKKRVSLKIVRGISMFLGITICSLSGAFFIGWIISEMNGFSHIDMSQTKNSFRTIRIFFGIGFFCIVLGFLTDFKRWVRY